MNFEQLLQAARNGEKDAKEEIFNMYRPLLIKESLINGSFDEDLYQELQEIMLRVVKTFKV